jgi:hypothetical protein
LQFTLPTMAANLTEDDWNLHKATIYSLYIVNNRKLREVIEEMSRKHDFNAT